VRPRPQHPSTIVEEGQEGRVSGKRGRSQRGIDTLNLESLNQHGLCAGATLRLQEQGESSLGNFAFPELQGKGLRKKPILCTSSVRWCAQLFSLVLLR